MKNTGKVGKFCQSEKMGTMNMNLNVINTRVANIIPILGTKTLVSLLNKVFTAIMPSIYYEMNKWRTHAPESILICFPNCLKNAFKFVFQMV